MNAWIFPGQGSQKVGMGRAWFESFDFARARFESASQVLGYDLSTLCFEGPAESLTDTRHAQPALLTVGVIAADVARHRGLFAQMAAGHSLGEYAALVAAQVLPFEEALQLVARRAELMSQAPEGTMAALIGMSDEGVASLIGKAGELGVIVAANDNSPGQIVVSGEVAAVECAVANAKGAGAKMAVKLPVSGAFHSPLMSHAGEELAALIDAAAFAHAQIPVYQNATAAPATEASGIKAALKAQMTGSVRWRESVQAMVRDGAGSFVELGPGKVLCGLVGRIDKSVACQNAEGWE
jgi:[acyl-carrier-protein] S-malonyltransferase